MYNDLTAWQQVIFRNYNVVESEKIANILKTNKAVIEENAKLLGLENIASCDIWLKKGFVTIIRNNWEILTTEQIIKLLAMEEREFNDLLVEYDFLKVKLGEKPNVVAPIYIPLTKEQQRKTKKIGEYIRSIVKKPTAIPFCFEYEKPSFHQPEEYAITDRYISSYEANYLGALLDDNLSDFSEEYLERLQQTGTNGIWLHETLRNLADFPFDHNFSDGYERRVNNLKKLTERCNKYGIGVYLYLNEPRALPASFFEKYPHLKGHEIGNGDFCLCTSVQETRDYLFNAVKSLVESVPMLKGIMTITMSENHTHCYSKNSLKTTCTRCLNRKANELAAEVNNIMSRAIRSTKSECRLIANLWGWAKYRQWTDEMIRDGIQMLDKEVDILCVSEFGKTFSRGGVENSVIDYSISVVGPSQDSINAFSIAKETGHRIWAKIQINNSWECAAVPYLPVFPLMTEHIRNLKSLGVSGLMLGWSQGGYPGGALGLCNMVCGSGEIDERSWYNATYADDAEYAFQAIAQFCKAFKEYPFSVASAYHGGQHLGVANMWSIDKDKRQSTMVCYSYDDERWAIPYGLEIYLSQYKKLCKEWQKGIEIIKDIEGNKAFNDLKLMAKGAYVQFLAAYHIALWCKYKKDKEKYRKEIKELIVAERENTIETYRLFISDARIGFEASNHYFFNANILLEKLLNLNEIEKNLYSKSI